MDTDEPVEVADLPAGDDEAESTTIYVKNLAFATTDATLRVSLLSTAGQNRMLILDFDTIQPSHAEGELPQLSGPCNYATIL